MAAVGRAEGSSLHQLRRVDLLSRDQALAWEGEQGEAAILLLRYAFALVLLSDKRKYVCRPIVEYSEDAESLRDFWRSRAERIEAFGILARRAGALRVEVPADTAV